MSSLKFFLVISFLLGVSCECEHEWLTFSDVNFFKSQAITAGEFKRGFPAYVGQGKNPKGRSVPGRIQHERSSLKLFYPANKKIETSTRDVKFLRQNPEYNYAWIDADSRKCIDNGVMVDESFYIGRTEEGDFAYIGQVNVGERLLHYENSRGLEVTTNNYQILTCTVNSQAEKFEICTKNLTDCETSESELRKINSDLTSSVRLLESEKRNCILVRDLYSQTNEMQKENLQRKTNELQECKRGGPDIDVRGLFTTSSPCIDNSHELQTLQQQNAELQRQNNQNRQHIETLNRQLSNANTENNQLKEQNRRYQEQMNAVTNHASDTLQEDLEKINSDFQDLQRLRNDEAQAHKRELDQALRELNDARAQIKNLNNQLSAVTPCNGVDGCINALASITQFDPTEETRLLQVIREKLNQDEKTD